MGRLIIIIAITASILLGTPLNALSLRAESIIRLKQAGISDATIELLIEERSIETAAFSVSEILALKNAGISEKTLQAVIRSGSFLRGNEPIVYGRAVRPIRLSSVEDIIEMRNSGFSDEVLQAVLAVVNPDDGDERRRAFDLLESMNIRVDLRGD